MSNRLQLCQRLAKEAGISGASNGTLPASTANQSGEMLSIVTWIDDAHEDIQSLHNNWNFLRADFTFPVTSGTNNYTPATAGLAEHQRWANETCDDAFTCWLTSVGVTDEQPMQYVPWREFKVTYGFSSMRENVGRPYIYTIKPDDSVTFYPIPDDTYTIEGEYFKRPYRFTANTSEPLFPREFHMAIVWQALMLYGGFETATTVYAHAQREYNRLIGKLQMDQLPLVEMPDSLI